MADQDSAFLDMVYDAAVSADRWVAVIERFADLTGSSNGFLSRFSVVDGTGVGLCARIDPEQPERYHQYYRTLNPFSNEPDPAAYMATWTPKVLTDEDYVPRDALVRSEYFNDFIRANDGDSCMIVRLSAHQFEVCALSLNRPHRRGRFERRDLDFAERMRPHIQRAFELTQKLSDAGLHSPDVDAALDHSPLGLFLLDSLGRVRRTNRMADRLLAQHRGLSVVGGRLTGSQGFSARRLGKLISQAAGREPDAPAGGSMVLPAPPPRAPLSVTVSRVQATGPAVFGQAPGVLVCVTDPDAQGGASAERLVELFGFTPAEARVALALMDGAGTREAAARLGVSFHTVRHQVQSMLDKTGAARQADLIARLTRASIGSLS